MKKKKRTWIELMELLSMMDCCSTAPLTGALSSSQLFPRKTFESIVRNWVMALSTGDLFWYLRKSTGTSWTCAPIQRPSDLEFKENKYVKLTSMKKGNFSFSLLKMSFGFMPLLPSSSSSMFTNTRTFTVSFLLACAFPLAYPTSAPAAWPSFSSSISIAAASSSPSSASSPMSELLTASLLGS